MQSIAPAPAPQSMQHRDQDMSADNDLRAQLAAVISHSAGSHGYTNEGHASNSASPHDHNIDPAIGGGLGGMMSAGNAGDSGGEDSLGDGRKGGKRELSQSKRAAQNRAAQRAFRQRKEGYIKKLEEQVREFHDLEVTFKIVQSENYSLREYIIHLQSRLIESQGEYPQPPPNISLSNPELGRLTVEHAKMLALEARNDQIRAGLARSTTLPPTPEQVAAQLERARKIAEASLGASQQDRYSSSKAYKPAGVGASASTTNEPSGTSDEDIIRSQLQQAGSEPRPTSMSM